MGKIGLIYAMEAELESLLERSGAEKLETVAGVGSSPAPAALARSISPWRRSCC